MKKMKKMFKKKVILQNIQSSNQRAAKGINCKELQNKVIVKGGNEEDNDEDDDEEFK